MGRCDPRAGLCLSICFGISSCQALADVEADRERAVAAPRAVAAAPPERLLPTHPAFGPMSARDWYRSAYRHADHHLRQFGV